MWAKVFSQVIISLVTSLAGWAWKYVSKLILRKKQHTELEKKVQKVEDAKTHDEVIAAANDLP